MTHTEKLLWSLLLSRQSPRAQALLRREQRRLKLLGRLLGLTGKDEAGPPGGGRR